MIRNNFNNRGGGLRLNFRSDWRPTANDLFLFTVSANGTDFHVTNDLGTGASGTTAATGVERQQPVGSLATRLVAGDGHRARVLPPVVHGETLGSEFDTPLFAAQDRRNVRLGDRRRSDAIARTTHFEVGMEASRVSLREFFTFAVTDEEEAEEHDISDAALEFDRDDPFRVQRTHDAFSLCRLLQDTFTPLKNLTSARACVTTIPTCLSPISSSVRELAQSIFIEKTSTAFRGSFNRLYMPPQVENLLLASSEQARQLSPFATPAGGGSAVVHPEKVSAYEVGFAQDVFGLFKFDAAYWHRSFRNYDDPNVFFNTTIVFPNSVAAGFARGVDARIDVPERRGWSGYVSYGNARILQTGPINGGLFLDGRVHRDWSGNTFHSRS